MFKSVSNCTPNSRIAVSFVATKNELLVIDHPGFAVSVLVYVNVAQVITQPIAIEVGDTVLIELDAPAIGGHRFISYSLGGIEHSFAVVSKDDYRPTVKPNDAPRRWFNYFPKSVRATFYDNFETQIDRPLGRTLNFVDIDRSHVVLDHITDKVNFYYLNRELVTSVKMPSGPIEYAKSTYIDENNDTRVELFVLCVNKVLYRIRFNNRFSASGEFFPTVTFIRSLEQIWYEADLPTGESFIDARRNNLRQRLNPPMTALDVFGSTVWAAGYDTVYILNKNFEVLQTVLIGTETIVNIACFDGANAYAVTRTGKIWRIQSNGFYNLIYTSSTPLGAPARFQPPGEPECILVPDPDNRRLLKITGPSAPILANSWDLGDFAPAYARVFDNDLWVTGHDTNRVLRLKSRTDITEYIFKEKVTIVSVEYKGDVPSILAVHYLKNFTTLNLTGIRRTVPITLEQYRGPMSHIGTRPYKLTLLGAEGMPIYAAPGVTCWINGIDGELATTGDHLSISYKAQSEGLHSVAFVLGNRAYDYKVEVSSNADKTDFFVAGATAINRLNYANANVIYTPTVGNVRSGTTSINTNFKINFFGSYYTQVNVGTNGYITFGNNRPIDPFTSIGSLGTDAIYIEGSNNGDLTQALPKTNISGITTVKPLPSGRTPGVYYYTDVVGDERYLRIAWVGFGDDLYPDGNDIPITTTITNSTKLPVLFSDLVRANVGDYLVGNSITSSTRVTSKITTALRNFEAYEANGNDIYVYSYTDSVTQVDQYSEVIGYNRFVIANSKSVVSSILPNGSNRNYVLDSKPSFITVNGNVHPSVGPYHSVIVPVLSPMSTIYRTDILSYDLYENTITVVSNIATAQQQVGNILISGANHFLVSNVDAEYFYINQEVLSSNIAKFVYPPGVTTPPRVISKYVSQDGTYIGLTIPSRLEAGDIVTVKRTEIMLSMPDVVLAGRVHIDSEITYELSKLTLNDSASILVGENIDVQGYFLVVDKPVSGFVGTTYNFKEDRPVREYTYEVGFYSGKRFQYIEVFYDNTNHQALNPTVITSRPVARGNPITISANVPAGTSYIFASEVGTGQWANIGIGSYDFRTTKTSLQPKFVRVPAYTPNDSNIEFLVDQEFKTNSNVLISTTFGMLTVNGGFYRGRSFIKENDIVRLSVPFNKSSRAVAPVISIGDFQYPVPTITSAAANLLIEHTFLTDNYPVNELFEYTFTVPAVDNYYIPDLYRSVSGVADYTYTLITGNVVTSLFSGNTYSLTPTSQVNIKGVISSSAIYDSKDIVFIGERNAITVRVRTETPGLVNYLNFGNINRPYTNNVEYVSLPGNLIEINNDVGYLSSNLVLTSSANITQANLYINDLGASFVYNGSVTKDRWVPNLAINSNIGLKRDFVDYFQGDATVYQVYYDAYAVSNVYIPVGTWNVTNKPIVGPDYSPPTETTAASLTNYSIPNGSVVIPDRRIESLWLNPFVYLSDPLVPLRDVFYQFPALKTEILELIQPSYLNLAAERTVLPNTRRPTFLTFQTKSRKIGSPFHTLSIISKNTVYTPRTQMFVSRVTVNQSDIQYNYIMAGGVAGKYIPYNDVTIGSIVGTGDVKPSYFELGAITGLWEPAATEDVGFHPGLKDGTTSVELIEFDWLVDELPTLEKIRTGGLVGDPSFYGVQKNDFDKEYVPGLFNGKHDGIRETPYTDDARGNHIPDTVDNMTYLTSSKSQKLIDNFAYWWFSWENKTPGPETEMPGRIFVDKYLPESEWSNGMNFLVEQQSPEAYTAFLAKFETTSTEFEARTFQDFGKKFTEIVFNYGQLVDELYTELTFDVLKSELAGAGPEIPFVTIEPFVNRAEEAYVPAFGYINHKPIDKLLLFRAPFLVYNGPYRQITKFITPAKTETNITTLPLVPEVEQGLLLLFDLIPIFDLSTMLRLPFVPLKDNITLRLIELPPVLSQIPLITIGIEFIIDIVPELLLPLEFSLLKDEVWEMDEITEYGTYSTSIKTWVDQAQHSDWWNLKRIPNDVTLFGRPFNLIKMYSQEYNYIPGGFVNDGDAEDEKVKYYNSAILPIPGTSYWNYRIYFKQRHFCVPKKGVIFPVTWLIRGG